MAKSLQRLQARALRRKGWSVGSISRKLRISKSSASLWCIDIALTKKQRQHLMDNSKKGSMKGRLLGAAANRQKKLDAITLARKSGKENIKTLSERERLLIGLGLYWGEGVKADKSRLAIANSDPYLVKFMYKCFRKVFKVPKAAFSPQIFINKIHKTREQKIVRFWSDFLDLPETQFSTTVFLKVKNKKVYENHDSYYGVLALRVRKGISLKYRILGLIEAIGGGKIMPG